MRSIRTLLIGCLMTMFLVPVASASVTVRLTLAELSDASVAIVRGRVVAIDSAWDRPDGAIYSYVVVRVVEELRGDVPKRITLKQLGGTVDGLTLAIDGQAEFRRGEEVVLFLGLRERDLTLQTSTLWQGKWSVDRGVDGVPGPGVTRYAGRDEEGALVGRETLALSELRRAARGVSPASRVMPQGVSFRPPEAPRPTRGGVRGSHDDEGAGAQAGNLGHSWHEAFSRTKIPVSFTDIHQPGLFIGSGKAAVKISWHFWDNVTHAINFLTNGGKYTGSADGTDIRGGSCTGDIVVFNQDPNGEIDNSSGTIAFGGAYFNDSISVRGLKKACNGFIVGNDSETANRYMDNFVCYENILKHEMGHVAGLSHVSNSAALMFATLGESRCNWPFWLHAVERDNFRAIYGEKYR